MHHLPECIGEQRNTHRYVSKILIYQLCFIFSIYQKKLQEVSVFNRLKDHYYVYRALLQMVEILANIGLHLQEAAFEKMAGVFEAIRIGVYYMLWWVVSMFVIHVYLLIKLEYN